MIPVSYPASCVSALKIGERCFLELRIGTGKPGEIEFALLFNGNAIERGVMGWRDVTGILALASSVSRYAVPPETKP